MEIQNETESTATEIGKILEIVMSWKTVARDLK